MFQKFKAWIKEQNSLHKFADTISDGTTVYFSRYFLSFLLHCLSAVRWQDTRSRQALASLIFAPFGKAQKSLALHSLIAKIGLQGDLVRLAPDKYRDVWMRRVGLFIQIVF